MVVMYVVTINDFRPIFVQYYISFTRVDNALIIYVCFINRNTIVIGRAIIKKNSFLVYKFEVAVVHHDD